MLRRAARAYLRDAYAHRGKASVRAVFVDDGVSTGILIDGFYELRFLDVLAREVFPRLPTRSTALDVGANIGNHSAFLARHFVRTVAFEPNPVVLPLLRYNATNLSEGRFEVVPTGLSDAPGKLSFRVCDGNLGASRVTDGNADALTDALTDTMIDVDTLDGLSEGLGLDDVSFVKIDCEGHEARVIAGASDLLYSMRPVIALEGFYADDPEKGARVQSMLQDIGYRHFYRIQGKILTRLPPFSLRPIDGLSGRNHSLVIASTSAIP